MHGGIGELASVNRVNDPTGDGKVDPAAGAVATACPAGVDQPGSGLMTLELLGKEQGVDGRVADEEGCAEAG